MRESAEVCFHIVSAPSNVIKLSLLLIVSVIPTSSSSPSLMGEMSLLRQRRRENSIENAVYV